MKSDNALQLGDLIIRSGRDYLQADYYDAIDVKNEDIFIVIGRNADYWRYEIVDHRMLPTTIPLDRSELKNCFRWKRIER